METEEREKWDLVIKTVGSLPLLRDVRAQMDCARLIDTQCPRATQADLSCGTVADLLVANRLQAPNPLDTGAQWAKAAGGGEVVGIPADLLHEDRLGRVAERLGQQAPGLKGESARHMAQAFHLGVEQMHWDLPSISVEGA